MAYTAAPRAGGGWQPVWSWNETDVSQFTLVVGSGAISFKAADFDTPNRDAATTTLVPCINVNANGAAARSIWTINDFTPLTGHYFITGLCDENTALGVVPYYQDTTHWVSWEKDATGSFWHRYNGASGEEISVASKATYEPHFCAEVHANIGSAQAMFKSGTGLVDVNSAYTKTAYLERAADWTGSPALDGGWDGTFASIGITLDAGGAATSRDLAMLQIWQAYPGGEVE